MLLPTRRCGASPALRDTAVAARYEGDPPQLASLVLAATEVVDSLRSRAPAKLAMP